MSVILERGKVWRRLIAKRENYVDYIAGRPRVERIGEHGLFTDEGEPVILRQVQKEVAEHNGVDPYNFSAAGGCSPVRV